MVHSSSLSCRGCPCTLIDTMPRKYSLLHDDVIHHRGKVITILQIDWLITDAIVQQVSKWISSHNCTTVQLVSPAIIWQSYVENDRSPKLISHQFLPHNILNFIIHPIKLQFLTLRCSILWQNCNPPQSNQDRYSIW